MNYNSLASVDFWLMKSRSLFLFAWCSFNVYLCDYLMLLLSTTKILCFLLDLFLVQKPVWRWIHVFCFFFLTRLLRDQLRPARTNFTFLVLAVCTTLYVHPDTLTSHQHSSSFSKTFQPFHPSVFSIQPSCANKPKRNTTDPITSVTSGTIYLQS